MTTGARVALGSSAARGRSRHKPGQMNPQATD